MRLAIVTSLEASGLAPKLLAELPQDFAPQPHIIITGSGHALDLLARGDIDIAITHDPVGEQRLIDNGTASRRDGLMHNWFMLVGPQDDPAHIAHAPAPASALKQIAAAQHPFISRGDLSGTHQKERALWGTVAITPSGAWYRSIGSGAAASVRMIYETGAYGLIDEASFAALAAPLGLRGFGFTSQVMRNSYSVMLPAAPSPQAQRLAAWLVAAQAQQIIEDFTLGERQVYRPANGAAGLRAAP